MELDASPAGLRLKGFSCMGGYASECMLPRVDRGEANVWQVGAAVVDKIGTGKGEYFGKLYRKRKARDINSDVNSDEEDGLIPTPTGHFDALGPD